MKTWLVILTTISVTIVTSVVLQRTGTQAHTVTTEQKESVYERVMRTGVIRAAYMSYPPAVIKDTTTGKLSGTFVDTLEEVAKNLNLKLEWTEDVGWTGQIEGLNTDRYDIVGSPVWANPNRGKITTMSVPVYYSGIGVWVRNDESRFEKSVDRVDWDFSKINNANIRIGIIDGETGDLIARTAFPNAQRVSSIQSTDISEKFLELKTGKSDVTFAEPFFGFEFLRTNPGTVKNIAAAKPIQVLGNCYMFKKNEFQMKQMLDATIEGLLNSGFIDRVLSKYEKDPGTFYRVADPYKPTASSR